MDNNFQEYIKIRGARAHNLKNIDVDIPRNKLVVITGLSGSGKSSLAFDTLYAEGQRRYVESLSAYARQFLGVMDKPDADKIEGISPAISIDQRKAMHNPRSTVGTTTEIYDYLRLLFSRVGVPHCPKCGKEISRQTIDQIVSQILSLKENSEILILGPVIRGKKGEHKAILEEIQKNGFVRVRVDGVVLPVEEALQNDLEKNKKHNIEAVVDRLIIEKNIDKSRFADSLEVALKIGKGIVIISSKFQVSSSKFQDIIFSENFACDKCGISLPDLEPRLFSFNNPFGACPECTGLGEKLEIDPDLVIPNKNLTLGEGAIIPWMRASHRIGRQSYFWNQLLNLAEKYNFSLDEPVKNLPKKIIDLLIFGEKDYVFGNGEGGFEGVARNLERRHKETESDWSRQEIEQYMIVKKCEKCQGKRLRPEVLAVKVNGVSIDEISEMSVEKAKIFFEKLASAAINKNIAVAKRADLKNKEAENFDQKIVGPIAKEIINRLQFLADVGLDYLTLDRKAKTLSGGEEQRIRLATQIGSRLTGVLYILDEPSIGLHPRDQGRLILTLKKLRDFGNTVVVVEHDNQTILAADWVVEIGPGAGKRGGKIVFEGTPKNLLKSKTLTGEYLSGRKKVAASRTLQACSVLDAAKEQIKAQKFLIIKGAREHNLKNIEVKIPLGKFVCVTGVSGSGKSTLINDILAKSLLKKFYRAKEEPGLCDDILGTEQLDKIVLIDQSPIGRTPRSNSATYTGAFALIRDIFSKTREARIKGYSAGRFSFNVKGGRCEACEGQGQIKVEMYFLPDVWVECQDCQGKRYNKEALEINYKGKNIAEVLEMTIEEALEFFKNIPGLFEKLKTLKEVGLSYLALGQPAPFLSGGEAQRVKLATELSRRDTGRTLYILDEPTTGLHADDIQKLVQVLRNLADKGNTVAVIEHNLDLIRNSDWIIDLGPEGGDKGGFLVAEGAFEDIKKNKKSYTGKYLREIL